MAEDNNLEKKIKDVTDKYAEDPKEESHHKLSHLQFQLDDILKKKN